MSFTKPDKRFLFGIIIEPVLGGKERIIQMRLIKESCLILGLLFMTATASAQNSQQTLRNELERTDRVITEAKEIVPESGSLRARDLLLAAIALQNRAYTLANNAGMDQTMTRASGKYTSNAREKAQRAIAIVRQSGENEDYVRRRLERTESMIARIEEKVGPEAPEKILLLLNSAREKQNRARELFRNRRMKMSLQLTLQSQKSIERLRESVGGYIDARRQYEMLQQRYYSLMGNIELAGLDDHPQIIEGRTRSEKYLKEAEMLAEEGHYRRSSKAMQNAVKYYSRAAESIREPEKVKRVLERLKGKAEILGEKIETSSYHVAKQLYQNARKHLEKAARFYNERKYDAAAAQLQAAAQILNRVAKIVE